MYWNNSWVNFFNKKNFFNKTLFFENIFVYLFSDKLFNFFFLGFLNKFKKKFFKFILKTSTKPRYRHLVNSSEDKRTKKIKKTGKKKIKYNFTKIWFIKYNNYILFTTFVFFYFKIKKKKKKISKLFFKKRLNIFWKKKRGVNLKKKKLLVSTAPHLFF